MLYLDGAIIRMSLFDKVKNHFQLRYNLINARYKTESLHWDVYMALFEIEGENMVEDYILKTARHNCWIPEADVWFSLCYAAGPDGVTPTQANYWLNYYENKGMIMREGPKFKYPSFEHAQKILEVKTNGINYPN